MILDGTTKIGGGLRIDSGSGARRIQLVYSTTVHAFCSLAVRWRPAELLRASNNLLRERGVFKLQSVEYAERVSGIAFVTVAEAESIRQFLKLPDLSILAKAKLSCSRDMFTRWALKRAIAAAPAGEELPQTSLSLKQRKEWNKLVLAYWKGERKAPPAIRVRIIDAGDLCIFGRKSGCRPLREGKHG